MAPRQKVPQSILDAVRTVGGSAYASGKGIQARVDGTPPPKKRKRKPERRHTGSYYHNQGYGA